ncbi:MAG: hypothetical protein M3457_13740 [Chloroflexota bacterium]|nr:hypothetical protein [Chloroflexota bacterium]
MDDRAAAKNIHRVRESADHKLPDEIPAGASIQPRVLKDVFEEGSFVEDEPMPFCTSCVQRYS